VTAHLRAAAAAPTEDQGAVPADMVVEGRPHTAGVVVHRNADGSSEAGIWECTAGAYHVVCVRDEFCHLLAGRVTVTEDGGEPLELQAGDCAMFPRGWSGTWRITEPIRKAYMIA
jgi:uncharacterized cupin superfamily protein